MFVLCMSTSDAVIVLETKHVFALQITERRRTLQWFCLWFQLCQWSKLRFCVMKSYGKNNKKIHYHINIFSLGNRENMNFISSGNVTKSCALSAKKKGEYFPARFRIQFDMGFFFTEINFAAPYNSCFLMVTCMTWRHFFWMSMNLLFNSK